MNSPTFQDFIIFNETEPCPYLAGRTARMPLAVPGHPLTPAEADRRFAAGQRRSGEFVYSTDCPACQACQPIRLDVRLFRPNATQRRAWRRGNMFFSSVVGPLTSDHVRVDLFNRHRQLRGLAREQPVDLESYSWGLGRSCFDAFELDYYAGDRLCAVAICDRGQNSLSAVYTYFDPQLRGQSPGTYSILKQVEYCRANDLQYLYLGYYIGESRHMVYKAQFRPHQRLQGGQWREFG
jgi:arginine-tRNA-protein transferase